MIRRDYILRMIEEFIRALATIHSLKKDRRWQEAAGTIDGEFKRLIRAGVQEVTNLTETELLARLMEGEAMLVVHDKTLLLTALFKEAGDVAVAQGRSAEGRANYLTGLKLMLGVLGRVDLTEFPQFVPKVEAFVAALQNSALPLETQALLMHHYERTGEFAKAEDALFAMIEGDPDNTRILEFGISFYQRLKSQTDEALTAGNLPRPELEASLAELGHRRGCP